MSGGGLGGAAGAALGAALAPETGGLSLAIPAIVGAGGGYLGGKLTGSKNPLMDALMGGIGGGLTGYLNPAGIENSAGLWDAGATGASGAADAALPALSSNIAANASAMPSTLPSLAAPSAAASGTGSSGILGYLGKQNPLNLALAGGSILSGAQSLMSHPKVNTAQNAANVMATNPGFNTALPKYALQNTATPYSGNWYTYGETPQTPMYNAQPVLQAAQGGLVGYAKGGQVKGYADGGAIMPQQPMPQASQIPVNPLTLAAAHKVGTVLGQHLKMAVGHTPLGQVRGAGGGHDDAIPAKLSQDEYVMSADIPAALGDGSSNEGAKILDKFVHNIRKHKTSKGGHFPPKAKNPLSYLPKKAKV